MRVAILGAGAIGLGMAALLCEAGHDAVLWSPSGRSTAGLRDGPLIATGVLEGSFAPALASTCAEALARGDGAAFGTALAARVAPPRAKPVARPAASAAEPEPAPPLDPLEALRRRFS